jgi:hypothetical protein
VLTQTNEEYGQEQKLMVELALLLNWVDVNLIDLMTEKFELEISISY